MKSVFVKLKEYAVHATRTEEEIIKYILINPKEVCRMSVHDLAKETFASASSIIRLSQKLGYDGLKELKQAIIEGMTLQRQLVALNLTNRLEGMTLQRQLTQKVMCDVEETDSVALLSEKMLHKHMLALQDTKALLDFDVIERCVERLIQARCIYVFGIGASFLVAQDLYQKMLRVGKLCVACEDYHLQYLQATQISKQDVAIVISYSGQTKEMITCCEVMKNKGVPIISILKFGASRIAALSDYRLYVTATEILIRRGAMSSRISQLYMVDVLYSHYINREREKAYKSICETQLYKEEHKEKDN